MQTNLRVKLSGQNGNAFNLLGLCVYALKTAGYSQEVVDRFISEATSGDYDNLLQTTMKWFNVI